MEALDVIEKRIDNLNRILGTTPSENNDSGGDSLTDSLLSANTLISSAVSGREKITPVIDRVAELETYLDPAYVDEHQNIKGKEVYINTVANDIATNFDMLEQIKSLESTLGAEYFRNIPDVTDKLKGMNEVAGEHKQKCDLFEESLMLAMQRYSEIQNNIKDSLQSMNERIDHIENKVKQSKRVDKDE
jgi:dynactin 3